MAQKVTKYFGYNSMKICRQELLRIAQSCHTAMDIQVVRTINLLSLHCHDTDTPALTTHTPT